MAYDNQNIFARILRGEVPCKKISEDEYHLAFHDVFPKAPIHGLVIPKGPYRDAQDFHQRANIEEIAGFYKGAAKAVEALDLREGGFRIISNAGVNGGQEVPHYHIHILGGRKLGPMVVVAGVGETD